VLETSVEKAEEIVRKSSTEWNIGIAEQDRDTKNRKGENTMLGLVAIAVVLAKLGDFNS